MGESFDFGGWATKNDLRCSDGRIIRKNAFEVNDGQTVPLVWNHQHNDPLNVLGHALLENRDDGVYAYCTLNDTIAGKDAKELIRHGDVKALSIYANQLKQQGSEVLHGMIREVSLVLAGANPGASIDSVIMHGEYSDEDGVIYTGESLELEDLEHAASDPKKKEEETMTEEKKPTEEQKPAEAAKPEEAKPNAPAKDAPATEPKDDSEETVADVLKTLNEKQQTVVYALLKKALNGKGSDPEETKSPVKEQATDTATDTEKKEGEKPMKHNVFDNDEQNNANVLSHSDEQAIFADAQRCGSLRDAVLQHGVTNEVLAHSVTDIETLFPDAKNVTATPQFIDRDQAWVSVVMSKTHHTPFSRIKSSFANITADEARARGYVKGKKKLDEVFTLLKRTTTPQTIYKKQTLDRDDILDITDFDVVSWIRGEMRGKLDEEIARAILVGDGRLSFSDDKIQEANIRPIWTDDDLYTIKATVSADATPADVIDQCVLAREDYQGSGNTIFFTTFAMLAKMLLSKDTQGHRMYKDKAELATAMLVNDIVAVPVMKGLTRTVETKVHTLLGIIVDMSDYNVGADKGGEVNMFDDFDIDYNQQKYLIETRCSGALIKPYSAIAVESVPAA
jgi:HK97 family phage prohead protease